LKRWRRNLLEGEIQGRPSKKEEKMKPVLPPKARAKKEIGGEIRKERKKAQKRI